MRPKFSGVSKERGNGVVTKKGLKMMTKKNYIILSPTNFYFAGLSSNSMDWGAVAEQTQNEQENVMTHLGVAKQLAELRHQVILFCYIF